jgi:hypothetical protein
MKKKYNKFFITALVVGLVAFSSIMRVPLLVTDAQVGTNATLPTGALNGKAIKLVVISRTTELEAPASAMPSGEVQCHNDEVVTGGGFKLTEPSISTIVASNKVENGWAISFLNYGAHPTAAVIYAQCAHIEISP